MSGRTGSFMLGAMEPKAGDAGRSGDGPRIALLGTGFMGKAHSNAWGQVGRFFDADPPRLSLLCGRDPVQLAELAKRFSWERTTRRIAEVLRDPGIDLVDIGLPNDLHAEAAIGALEEGKHVACEKPLARDLGEARAMRDAARRARRRGLRSFVWFNYRRCPAAALARMLVREGRIGPIRRVEARYLQSWGGPGAARTWRFRKSKAGSGALGDLGAHIVDLARFVTGLSIVEIRGASMRTFFPKRKDPEGGRKLLRSDVDDAVGFLASFEGGAPAVFEASRVATGHLNANLLEVDGERGSLRFAFESMNRLEFFDAADGPRTGGWRSILCTTPGAHPWVEAWWPEAHLLGYEHGFVNQAADILAVLSGREPEVPLPDFEDAYETQRVLEAVRISWTEGRPVKLREVR